MSLTGEDLLQIRSLFEEFITPMQGEIEALRNDIKEIYDMIAGLEKSAVPNGESFQKLSAKDQILKLNAAVVELAKKEGITLPR